MHHLVLQVVDVEGATCKLRQERAKLVLFEGRREKEITESMSKKQEARSKGSCVCRHLERTFVVVVVVEEKRREEEGTYADARRVVEASDHCGDRERFFRTVWVGRRKARFAKTGVEFGNPLWRGDGEDGGHDGLHGDGDRWWLRQRRHGRRVNAYWAVVA